MDARRASASDDGSADRLRVGSDEVLEHDLIEVDRALLEEREREPLLTGVGVDRGGHRRGRHVGVADRRGVGGAGDGRTRADLRDVDAVGPCGEVELAGEVSGDATCASERDVGVEQPQRRHELTTGSVGAVHVGPGLDRDLSGVTLESGTSLAIPHARSLRHREVLEVGVRAALTVRHGLGLDGHASLGGVGLLGWDGGLSGLDGVIHDGAPFVDAGLDLGDLGVVGGDRLTEFREACGLVVGEI